MRVLVRLHYLRRRYQGLLHAERSFHQCSLIIERMFAEIHRLKKIIFHRPGIPEDSENSASLRRPGTVLGLPSKRTFDLTKTFEFTAIFNFII